MKKTKISMRLPKKELFSISQFLYRDNIHLMRENKRLKLDLLGSLRTVRVLVNEIPSPYDEIYDVELDEPEDNITNEQQIKPDQAFQ